MIQIKSSILVVLNWLNFKAVVFNRGAKNRT